jgi:hypothetical protein
MTDAPEFIWVHCNECARETKHEIMSRVDRRRAFQDDRYTVEVGSVWETLRCKGCEEVSLHRRDWCSEDDPMDASETGTFFPPRVSRRKPDWAGRLKVPTEYKGLLDEIYIALHADSRRLAMMGVRALIDEIIRSTVGDQGNFGKGLQHLVDTQLISQRNREIIEAAVDVGHASAHRGYKPNIDNVNLVIDIVENLIHNEILSGEAESLRLSTPKRKKAVKATGTE